MIYAKIDIEGYATDIQPLDELDLLIEEIRRRARSGDIGKKWTIELIEMEPSKYNAYDEFMYKLVSDALTPSPR